jgi:predicted transcriptional regulator
MTPNPITVTPDMPVSTVTTIMLAKRINCVPVVEDGKLMGIVTTSDLLMALQCVLKLIEQLSLPSEVGEVEIASDSVSKAPGHTDEKVTLHPPATPA